MEPSSRFRSASTIEPASGQHAANPCAARAIVARLGQPIRRPNPPFQPTAAREIVPFLTRFGGALAAAERQSVGRLSRLRRIHSIFDIHLSVPSTRQINKSSYTRQRSLAILEHESTLQYLPAEFSI